MIEFVGMYFKKCDIHSVFMQAKSNYPRYMCIRLKTAFNYCGEFYCSRGWAVTLFEPNNINCDWSPLGRLPIFLGFTSNRNNMRRAQNTVLHVGYSRHREENRNSRFSPPEMNSRNFKGRYLFSPSHVFDLGACGGTLPVPVHELCRTLTSSWCAPTKTEK